MRESAWPAIFLAAIAGFVDALGYLGLAHVFTAHMSGNSAATGAHLGTARWGDVVLRSTPIPAFIIGIMVGAFAVHLTARFGWRVRLAPAFGIEALLLIAALCAAPHAFPRRPEGGRVRLLLVLLASAMGVQSAALRRAGGARVRTTFISGMLTGLGEELAACLVGARKGPDAPAGSLRRAAVFAGIFVFFMAGAAGGGFAETHFGPPALLAPIAGLLIIILDDVITSGAHHGGPFSATDRP